MEQNQKRLSGIREMEIEETIDKWFEETYQKFRMNITPKYPVDRFVLSVFLVSRKYISSALLLLRNDHKMPTKALLRILCELLIKFEWCLGAYDKNQNNKTQKVEERRMRWWKSTLCYRIKELSKWQEVSNRSLQNQAIDQKNQLEVMYENVKNDCVKLLPRNFVDFMIKEMPAEIKSDVYPRFYLKYNDAIHLDIASLGFLLRKKEHHIEIHNDSPEKESEFLECIIDYAAIINSLIRKNYNWHFEEMQNEHKALLKAL